jgi:hypothetical protein
LSAVLGGKMMKHYSSCTVRQILDNAVEKGGWFWGLQAGRRTFRNSAH